MRKIKASILKNKMRRLIRKTSGIRHIDHLFTDELVMHCMADNATHEESVLYCVATKFGRAQNYYHCNLLRVRRSWPWNADEWYDIAAHWREIGGVSLAKIQEFNAVLDAAKSRWPQVFSGEDPYVRKHWEVHFDYMPIGVATFNPAAKPIKIFDKFSDATSYVEENSTIPYWWHSYDLLELEREGSIPEWEETPTPRKFDPLNKRGLIAYNHYNSREKPAGYCIFAMPHATYLAWLNAVEENDPYRASRVTEDGKNDNRVIDVETWCVRFVQHEEPIDNENPDANVIEAYESWD